jgi:hypothetical protein
MFYQARYYDPVIGRFTSADTVVPDPEYSQDYNRYSYVRNNPLRYTDPTGHNPLACALTGPFAGACVSGWALGALLFVTVGALAAYAADQGSSTTPATDLSGPSLTDWLTDAHQQANDLAWTLPTDGTWNVDLTTEDIDLVRQYASSDGTASGDARPLQTGGNTVRESTADALNAEHGVDLASREWGRAVEDLKEDLGLSPSFHGRISSDGSYSDPNTGEELGNLLDYL